jgi:hypothetical protein
MCKLENSEKKKKTSERNPEGREEKRGEQKAVSRAHAD